MNKITLSLLVLLSVVMYSCKDDGGNSPAPNNTVTHPLNGSTWLLTAATIDPAIDISGIPVTDLYAFYDDCDKDDETTFNADGTYDETEGATKCDPSDPQDIGSGTWTLSEDRKTLTFDEEELTVTTLNGTTMGLTTTFYDEDLMETYTTAFTFTKK